MNIYKATAVGRLLCLTHMCTDTCQVCGGCCPWVTGWGGSWKCPLLDVIKIALLSLCHFPASEEKEDFLVGLESPSSENRHSVCAVFLGSFVES